LLVTLPGGLAEEREFHERLSQYHHHGEWFVLSDEILDLIKELRLRPDPDALSVAITDRNGITWRTTPAQFFRWMEVLYGPNWIHFGWRHVAQSQSQFRKWVADAEKGICSIPVSGLRKLMQAHQEQIRLKEARARGPIRISFVNDRRRSYVIGGKQAS
jgi:hypothetical protein